MFCGKCGNELREGARFCPKCGNEIKINPMSAGQQAGTSGSTGGGTTVPPVFTPPVNTPPVNTPPVNTPPVNTPPLNTPPVFTPPFRGGSTGGGTTVPPVSTPPVREEEGGTKKRFPVWLLILIIVLGLLLLAGVGTLLFMLLKPADGGNGKKDSTEVIVRTTEEDTEEATELATPTAEDKTEPADESTEESTPETAAPDDTSESESETETEAPAETKPTDENKDPLGLYTGLWIGDQDSLIMFRADGTCIYQEPKNQKTERLRKGVACEWYQDGNRVVIHGASEEYDIYAATNQEGSSPLVGKLFFESTDSRWNPETFYRFGDEPQETAPAPASSDYILPSDTRYLTEDDLKGLTKAEIRIARNEIFARHGRKFDSADLRQYFESKSWYKGTIDPKTFDAQLDSYLNPFEIFNYKLINEYESRLK